MSTTSFEEDTTNTSETATNDGILCITNRRSASWWDTLDETEFRDIEEHVMDTIDEYVETHLLHYSSPIFTTNILKSVTNDILCEWINDGICDDDDDDNYNELELLVKNIYDVYQEMTDIPKRQQLFSEHLVTDKTAISDKIDRLRNIPQPTQRTKEWYESRYNMITASNISKALGSDSQRNSLIYEKCKPLVIYGSSSGCNTETSMHWGVKYEPVTKMIYEAMYCTQVADFGCIPHPKYPFIGASPDGIVTDPDHERYGHMVEIKNIFNREITGIPKEEYWIQMQVQMETCDLDYCDFVETRIKEYETVEHALADELHEYKGVLLHFVRKLLVAKADEIYDGSPHYVYMPLDIPFTQDSITQWIQYQRAEYVQDYVLFATKYWYCDEISCVLVPRNRMWFDAAVPKFVETWETIVRERIDGYEHRAAKKKTITVTTTDACGNHIIHNMPAGGGICLIKLDENGLANSM